MSSSHGRGRLGNQLIRNLACSILSEKFNLYIEYSSHDIIRKLGINLYVGTQKHNTTITLSDSNYFDILNGPHLNANINPYASYFQTKKITNLLYKHLRSEFVKSGIIELNSFKDRYSNNNDVYIHLRLDDAKQWNPGLNYYLKAIDAISDYSSIYLSTDEKDHTIIKEIQNKFPQAIILDYDEVKTIQFASTCKHVILSHGSFSAIIGYLAYDSSITYPDYSIVSGIWFGDIFSIDGWNNLRV
jgi:hypothetical protein